MIIVRLESLYLKLELEFYCVDEVYLRSLFLGV